MNSFKKLNVKDDAVSAVDSKKDISVIALKSEDIRFNGGQQCDMSKGPCSCGAWH
jgi:hypothetical protein